MHGNCCRQVLEASQGSLLTPVSPAMEIDRITSPVRFSKKIIFTAIFHGNVRYGAGVS